jgi:hypothetical protein
LLTLSANRLHAKDVGPSVGRRSVREQGTVSGPSRPGICSASCGRSVLGQGRIAVALAVVLTIVITKFAKLWHIAPAGS